MCTDIVSSFRVISTLSEPAAYGGAVSRRVVWSPARETREELAPGAFYATGALADPRLEYPLKKINIYDKIELCFLLDLRSGQKTQIPIS